ncbi:MAG: hypothetical protein AAF352_04280 [Pseudomonadota bacterium]
MAETLDVLIRLRQQTIDDLRIDLVALETQDATYAENLRMLEERLQQEALLAQENPLMGVGYAAYVKRARILRKQVEAERERLSREINTLKDEIGDHFAEKKKLEFVHEANQNHQRKWLNAQENKELDEIGMMIKQTGQRER